MFRAFLHSSVMFNNLRLIPYSLQTDLPGADEGLVGTTVEEPNGKFEHKLFVSTLRCLNLEVSFILT